MGHSSIAVTDQFYATFTPDELMIVMIVTAYWRRLNGV
jgi:hypothetical protein